MARFHDTLVALWAGKLFSMLSILGTLLPLVPEGLDGCLWAREKDTTIPVITCQPTSLANLLNIILHRPGLFSLVQAKLQLNSTFPGIIVTTITRDHTAKQDKQ